MRSPSRDRSLTRMNGRSTLRYRFHGRYGSCHLPNSSTFWISRIRHEDRLELAPTIGGLLSCPLWSAIRLASTTPTRIGSLQ